MKKQTSIESVRKNTRDEAPLSPEVPRVGGKEMPVTYAKKTKPARP